MTKFTNLIPSDVDLIEEDFYQEAFEDEYNYMYNKKTKNRNKREDRSSLGKNKRHPSRAEHKFYNQLNK